MRAIDRRTFVVGVAAAMARPGLVRAAEPLGISVVLSNSVHWVQFAAADNGFYRDAGFDAKVMALQSSPQSIQMALSGELQLATSQPETFVAAIEQGATVLGALAAPTNQCDWVLVGARGVTSAEDLRGKTIGLSSLRATEAWLTTRVLAQKGIQKDQIKFVVAGTSPAKIAALESANIGAAVMFQPTAEVAIRQGLVPLARYRGLRDYPTVLYVANKGWAAAGDAGKRAAAVLQRTHAWLWDPANKTEAIAILARYTKREPMLLEVIYDEYFGQGQLYSKTGRVERDGLRAVLADMAEDGTVFKSPPPVEKYLLDSSLGGLAG